MMKSNWILLSAALFSAELAGHGSEVKLPALFTDHMVLQRDAAEPVWGWARPGDEIQVEFAGQKKSTTADEKGEWMVKLDPLPASAAPRELTVCGRVIHDVLVGDVWLCSGQSNMGMSVREAADAEKEIASAKFDPIRMFSVARNPALEPLSDVKGGWTACAPESVAGFSAVSYFFGREIHRELGVPVGLLHSSYGATRAEAWTRLDALSAAPAWIERAGNEIAQIKSQEEDNRRFAGHREAWEKQWGVSPPPIAEHARGWADPSLETSDWAPVTLPATWGQLGAPSGGVFWVRKEVVLPDSAAGKPIRLTLDWLNEQYDTAFFNGVEVGRASDEAPEFYNTQRGYWMPGNLAKAGRNVIAVRIVAATQTSGVGVSGNPLGLAFSDPGAHDRNGRMKTETLFPPLSDDALRTRPRPNTLPFRDVSAALYNGMIAPLVPFAIKGAIWCQGESNTPRADEYRNLLSVMIADWRAQWKQGSFPFIIQQLVNDGAPAQDPNVPEKWPFLREAQMRVSEALPHCGIATGMDLGSAHTIHPPNKQGVGKRLALVALEKVYGQSVESSGPRFDSMTVEGAAMRVKFTHAAGLSSKDGPPKHFALAGADKRFVWADAKIDGDTVLVSSPEVTQPTAVRYAWANNPGGCNLYNAAGLPSAPFRADATSARQQ
jgi:sialate O-acetylesterase